MLGKTEAWRRAASLGPQSKLGASRGRSPPLWAPQAGGWGWPFRGSCPHLQKAGWGPWDPVWVSPGFFWTLPSWHLPLELCVKWKQSSMHQPGPQISVWQGAQGALAGYFSWVSQRWGPALSHGQQGLCSFGPRALGPGFLCPPGLYAQSTLLSGLGWAGAPEVWRPIWLCLSYPVNGPPKRQHTRCRGITGGGGQGVGGGKDRAGRGPEGGCA